MTRKASSVVLSRKPSISRIKNTESKKLLWEGKAIMFGNKIKEIDTDLKNLDKSKVRLKTTKRIKLMKSKHRLMRNRKPHKRKPKILAIDWTVIVLLSGKTTEVNIVNQRACPSGIYFP